jgi:tripartite-type tricarboxylate transporter receptor subunit TctC
MKLPRRNFLHLAACAAALPAASRFAWAQAYPTRPVRIIVGFPPGGPGDIVTRLMGQWLSERLGQPFIVENRAGAAGNIGTEAVVRAPADGYTLLLTTVSNAVNATLYDKLNFNFIRDVAPVAGVVRVPNVMEVNPSFPAKTAPEFIAYAKANPNKLNFGSGGNGTASHMQFELFKLMSGVSMVHVPYRGSAPALTDLLSGQIQLMFDPMPSSIGHIKADAFPSGGFRSVFLEIDAFHRERRIPVRRGRSRHEVKQVYIRFCFPDAATAEAFRNRFGGECLTHARAAQERME